QREGLAFFSNAKDLAAATIVRTARRGEREPVSHIFEEIHFPSAHFSLPGSPTGARTLLMQTAGDERIRCQQMRGAKRRLPVCVGRRFDSANRSRYWPRGRP